MISRKKTTKIFVGGQGSGRHTTYGLHADKCEDYHSIDLAVLRKEKSFQSGNSGTIAWSRRGRETGSVGFRIEADGMRLRYKQRRGDGDWRDIDDFVPFAFFNSEVLKRMWRLFAGFTQSIAVTRTDED